MKSLLAVFIFSVAVCLVFDKYAVGEENIRRYLTVTVFYESLGLEYLNIYKSMVDVLEDKNIAPLVEFELVPFGKAHYKNRPWDFVCEHGENECWGNIMNACFFEKNSEQIKQVKFLHCCMTSGNPPKAGEECAKKLGYDYDKVDKCVNNEEGVLLLDQMGNRTQEFKPKLTYFPSIVFDEVYSTEDQVAAVADLKALIVAKLKKNGMLV